MLIHTVCKILGINLTCSTAVLLLSGTTVAPPLLLSGVDLLLLRGFGGRAATEEATDGMAN